MATRPRTYYELLDIAPDAGKETIAVAYQRALEALAREHNADPDARASLRRAFEVLSDPVQRVSYDLSANARDGARYVSVAGQGEGASLIERLRGGVWGRALVVVAILLALVIWFKPGKSANVNYPTVAEQRAAAAVVAAAATDAGSAAATPSVSRPDAKPAPPTGPRSAEDIFNQVSQSVVRINVASASGAPVATGSGVVIGPGSVITNCHVALRGDLLEVKLADAAYSATVEVANEDRDLCLLSVSGLSAPAVSLGTVDSVRVGQRVYAVGAPQGLDLTISDGIVSALRESQGSKVIQTSAPVSPGSSGGGLFDTAGRMIGVVTFQTKAGQNLNFAVPADWVGEMRTH
jgi:serine protease Do